MALKQGKIIAVNRELRTVIIANKTRQYHAVCQRAVFNRYLRFLTPGMFVIVKLRTERRLRKNKPSFTITDFLTIVKPSPRRRVLFSQRNLRSETAQFINTLNSTMFLDLEMSMHPYRVDKSFTQEIIQVGYVLSVNDEIIERYRAFIRPKRHKTLTKRTLKFLDLTQKDVDEGITFEAFYNHFKAVLKRYNPAVIVWGSNDKSALKDAAHIHGFKPLDIRFVNLLKLHKNVFRLKDDLGLAKAVKLYGNHVDSQKHDALEDAEMTRLVFNGFKATLNDTLKPNWSSIKKPVKK